MYRNFGGYLVDAIKDGLLLVVHAIVKVLLIPVRMEQGRRDMVRDQQGYTKRDDLYMLYNFALNGKGEWKANALRDLEKMGIDTTPEYLRTRLNELSLMRK